jgi:hypothetical protein
MLLSLADSTGVLEDLAISIFYSECGFFCVCQTAWHHIPEYHNLVIQYCPRTTFLRSYSNGFGVTCLEVTSVR